MNVVTITRVAVIVQPYPRNGNVGTQKPVYDWIVRVNGKYVGHSRVLRKAKEIADDYAGKVTVVR